MPAEERSIEGKLKLLSESYRESAPHFQEEPAKRILEQVARLENIPEIARHLESQDLKMREVAAAVLGETKHPKAIPHLEKALQTGNFHVVWRSAESLVKIKRPKVLRIFLRELQREQETGPEDSRLPAAWALGVMRTSKAVRPLTKTLQTGDQGLRERSAISLGTIGSTRAIPALLTALKDSSYYVRGAVAEALGNIGHPRAVPSLIPALHDPNHNVQQRAKYALAKINHPKAIRPLIRMLEYNPRNREDVLWVLGQISRGLEGKKVKGKEARALQLVGPYFHENEQPQVVQKAFQAALKGKITPANARLYVKELRAMEGSLK